MGKRVMTNEDFKIVTEVLMQESKSELIERIFAFTYENDLLKWADDIREMN